jgi:signal transduction histidine kinase
VIPPADVDRLFHPFQRLGDERVRPGHERVRPGHDGGREHGGGYGLGLAIVRAIAAAHGAELSASPRPEGGLDITVAFPAVPGQP